MFKYLKNSIYIFKNSHHIQRTNLFFSNFNDFKIKEVFYPYSQYGFNITQEDREKLKIRYKKISQQNTFLKRKEGHRTIAKRKKERSLQIKQKNVLKLEAEVSPKFKEELDQQVSFLNEKSEEFLGVSKSGVKNILERIETHNLMKHMDSSFEGFFFKREFNLINFNYYLQILCRQGKPLECEEAIKKMEEMNISPTIDSYTQLLTAHARDKNIPKCEEIFSYVTTTKNFLPNKFFYNSLLLAYSKNLKIQESESLVKEMKNLGLKIDTVCYTTLVHAYKRVKQYDKCWEIYNLASASGIVDEFLISAMIRVCGITHEAEKALNLFKVMEIKGFISQTTNYNSLIYALSSRREYAEKAIETYHKMKLIGCKPDLYTYVGVLRATSNLGDINTANDVIKEIKLLGLTINEYICNGLLRTYAGAIKIKYVKSEHIENYIEDAWEVFRFMEKENITINNRILNAMVELHAAAHKVEMVDGLVLPLFEKYNIELNSFTYQHIFRMLLDKRNYNAMLVLYSKMKEDKIVPTQILLNSALEAGIRSDNADVIVETLETLREVKKTADPWLLRLLSNMYDLPDRIYAELTKHPLKYNLLNKARHKQFSAPQFRERTRAVPKVLGRRNGRRKKLR